MLTYVGLLINNKCNLDLIAYDVTNIVISTFKIKLEKFDFNRIC